MDIRQVYEMALDVVQALAAHPLVAPVLERPIDEKHEKEEAAAEAEGKMRKAKTRGGSKSGSDTNSTSSTRLTLLTLLERLHSQVRSERMAETACASHLWLTSNT
jgi:hypothetical protein